MRSHGLGRGVVLLGCVLFASPSLAQAAIGLTGWSSGGFSGVANNHGFEFSTTSAIIITDLGFHDVQWNGDGLATAHEIGIWRVSDQTLMVSATVPSGTAAPLDAEYRYVAVAPTLLSPGSYIVSAVTNDSDPYIWNFVAPTMSPPLTYMSGRAASPLEAAFLVYPNSSPTNNYAPANLKYAISDNVWGGAVWGELVWGGLVEEVPALHALGLFTLSVLLVGAGAYLTGVRGRVGRSGGAGTGIKGDAE